MEPDLDFYLQPGLMTALPPEIVAADLPQDIPQLVRLTQNALIHIFWLDRYGLKLPEARKQEVNIRSFKAKYARMLELDPIPFSQERSLDRRLVGNCRDFSVVLAALLKAKGIPARARCGFGTYFRPKHFEDHWVVEYWNCKEGRWQMVDAQLDALQQQALKIGFDPLNVPAYKFVTGAKAWLLCRTGQADSNLFGIHDMKGLWFVRGDLVRDFLALNNIEILPWDAYGLIAKHESQVTEADLLLLDRIASLCLNPQDGYAEIRAMYRDIKDLQVLPSILY